MEGSRLAWKSTTVRCSSTQTVCSAAISPAYTWHTQTRPFTHTHTHTVTHTRTGSGTSRHTDVGTQDTPTLAITARTCNPESAVVPSHSRSSSRWHPRDRSTCRVMAARKGSRRRQSAGVLRCCCAAGGVGEGGWRRVGEGRVRVEMGCGGPVMLIETVANGKFCSSSCAQASKQAREQRLYQEIKRPGEQESNGLAELRAVDNSERARQRARPGGEARGRGQGARPGVEATCESASIARANGPCCSTCPQHTR